MTYSVRQERRGVARRAGPRAVRRCCARPATERPWTGELLDESRAGLYTCAACGAELFQSGTKFDSHCGWPSFYESIRPEAVELHRGQRARHAAHRGALRDVRLAPRPRLPRRLRHAHRRPLLHELDRARVHPRSRRVTGALEAVRARRSWSKVTDAAPTHAELLTLRLGRRPRRRPLVAAALAAHRAARSRPRAPGSRDQQGRGAQGLVVEAAARPAADRRRRELPQERQGAALGAGGGRLGRRARAEPAAGRSRLGRHLAHGPLHAQQGRRQGARPRQERGAARLAVRRRQAPASAPRPAQGRRRAAPRLADAAPPIGTVSHLEVQS